MPVFEINHKRILFIHVPKTAGTSITAFLEERSRKKFDNPIFIYGKRFRPRHLHAAALRDIFCDGFFDYAFMVVRNPVSKLISEYSYQRRRSGFRWQNLTDFDRWLGYSLWCASLNDSYRENHFRPQSQFECFGCEVFRIEDGLSPIAARLSEIVGEHMEGPFEHSNISRKARVRLTEKGFKKILNQYAGDFARYGYSQDFSGYLQNVSDHGQQD